MNRIERCAYVEVIDEWTPLVASNATNIVDVCRKKERCSCAIPFRVDAV